MHEMIDKNNEDNRKKTLVYSSSIKAPTHRKTSREYIYTDTYARRK